MLIPVSSVYKLTFKFWIIFGVGELSDSPTHGLQHSVTTFFCYSRTVDKMQPLPDGKCDKMVSSNNFECTAYFQPIRELEPKSHELCDYLQLTNLALNQKGEKGEARGDGGLVGGFGMNIFLFRTPLFCFFNICICRY